eukprot:5507554-Pleurochrysis_carterae.AAC.1
MAGLRRNMKCQLELFATMHVKGFWHTLNLNLLSRCLSLARSFCLSFLNEGCEKSRHRARANVAASF